MKSFCMFPIIEGSKNMNFKTRTAEENHYVNQSLVNKYHRDISSSFNVSWIEKFQQYVSKGLVKFRFTEHCRQRSIEKKIPFISCENFIKDGVCFEYKLIGDTLYRFAVRFAGEVKDYIAVFQPQLRNGFLEMVVITYYTNDKNDYHSTLRTWEYCK